MASTNPGARRWPVRLSVLCAALLAGGCGGDGEDAPPMPIDSSANVLRARFSGDIDRQVTYRGEEVGIGYIPTAQGDYFSLGGERRHDGRVLSVTLGPLMGIALRPGPVPQQDSLLHGGMVGAGDAGHPDSYSSAGFDMFYDTSSDGSGGASTLVFTKVDKERSDQPLLVRYHLVGHFEVHTGYVPDELSQACLREAVMASSGGVERHPMYNAQLCGARRADVRARFDVRVELPAHSALDAVAGSH